MPDIQTPTSLGIKKIVAQALTEDIGDGDLTTAFMDPDKIAEGQIYSNEEAILCGSAWFNEVFRQLHSKIEIQWYHADGDRIEAGTIICKVTGLAGALLSGERTALNFLQILSGTATTTRKFVDATNGTKTKILDTRKTIPGLRLAQKYAVQCGGAENHRIGLFDGILIKENHILVAGSITTAVTLARKKMSNIFIEVETETIPQVKEALEAGPDRILLDNMTTEMCRQAVKLRNAAQGKQVQLEASGGIDLGDINQVAKTGVDYISVGAITKNARAIDISMRLM